jgi:Carbohydrate-selective porin, OprB family/S-layer homology domain
MKLFLCLLPYSCLLGTAIGLLSWSASIANAATSEINLDEVSGYVEVMDAELPDAELPDAELSNTDRSVSASFSIRPSEPALTIAQDSASPSTGNPSTGNPNITNAPVNAPVDASVRNETNADWNQQPMGQITSIDQLTDVQQTDWAYQALQSLVERYNCIVGYPDSTYRGNRALTRYEFAAGLNACLDRITQLISASTQDLVTQEDLATLQRLQEEFAVELTTLRGRVDTLEARTSELEANQFSTTTKLEGETIFGLISVLAGDNADGESAPRNPTFGYRVRLNLQTSFTGEDLLTTRLQASNVEPLGGTDSGVLGTNEGRIEFDGDSENEVDLALLRYVFPIGERTNIYLAGTGNGFVDLDASSQLTPYLDGSAVSLFALRNPIYNYSGGTGVGLRHFFNDNLELNLGYLVPNAGDPSPGNGLFNGKYGGLAQLIVYPTEDIRVGFSYINSYSPSEADFGLATGSNLANDDFGRPVVANAYGISGTFDITDGFAVGGWVGYSHHRYIGRGDGDVWTWAGSLSFPDLGGEGNLGGILVGMEPRLARIDSSVNNEADSDTSLHVEAFYRYRLSDNIDITPGVIWLTAPNHDANNDDVVIGVLRTRFFF